MNWLVRAKIISTNIKDNNNFLGLLSKKDYERIIPIINLGKKKGIIMTKLNHINYFKQQANLLLEDYKTRYFDQDIYNYHPKTYDITQIFLDYNIYDDEDDFDFNLNDAQNIIAEISGFKDWNDLSNSSEEKLDFAHLLLENQHHANLEEWNTYLSSIKGINWSGLLDPDNKFSDDDYIFFKEVFRKVFIEGNIQSDFALYKLDCEEKRKKINNYKNDDEELDSNMDENNTKLNSTNINYFKQQAKLLLKDYKLFKENDFDKSKIILDEAQEHFDIDNVFAKVNKEKDSNITLMNAQHIISKISGFDNWNELLHSSEAQMGIGALKLNAYKIGMDPNIISAAGMLVAHELFAEFVDDKGNVNYTDEDELDMWKSVMERLLF